MAKGPKKRWKARGLGLALVLGVAALSAARQARADGSPPAKLLWSKARSFQIPVTLSSKNPNRVRELILHVSDDQGENWKRGGKTTPDAPQFPVRVPRDGEYWYAVQTLDVDGKLYPNGDRPIEPTLRVIVDTTKPTIILEATARRGSEAGARWEVQDDHLLLRTLTLEYQSEGARDWRQVPLDTSELKLIGVKNWDAGTAETVRVRMSVRDQAGNIQTVEQILPDGLAANPGPVAANTRRGNPPAVSPISSRARPTAEDDLFGPEDAPVATSPTRAPVNELAESNQLDRDFDPAPTSRSTATQSNAAGPTLLVHNRKLALKYDVEDAGPNGPAFVQLWTTRDGGRTWTPQPEDADKRSPYNVDLGSDGTFGLWLVVQSASGLGDSPPASMDRPQSWVEVDATPPAVSVGQPKIGKGQHAGKVLITWKATDGHIAPQPISLFYREDKPEAPWVPIEEGRENNGRYVWSPQGSIPPRFHIKVEAVDTFGNRGSSDSQDYGAILLDRAKPKGRIIGLEQNDATTRQ